MTKRRASFSLGRALPTGLFHSMALGLHSGTKPPAATTEVAVLDGSASVNRHPDQAEEESWNIENHGMHYTPDAQVGRRPWGNWRPSWQTIVSAATERSQEQESTQHGATV